MRAGNEEGVGGADQRADAASGHRRSLPHCGRPRHTGLARVDVLGQLPKLWATHLETLAPARTMRPFMHAPAGVSLKSQQRHRRAFLPQHSGGIRGQRLRPMRRRCVGDDTKPAAPANKEAQGCPRRPAGR
jgi:hypothetical protein